MAVSGTSKHVSKIFDLIVLSFAFVMVIMLSFDRLLGMLIKLSFRQSSLFLGNLQDLGMFRWPRSLKLLQLVSLGNWLSASRWGSHFIIGRKWMRFYL